MIDTSFSSRRVAGWVTTLPLLALAAFSAGASPAPAPSRGALDRGLVPADAQWLVHIDIESARDTHLVRAAVALAERFDLRAELDQYACVEEFLGVDPFSILRSLTVFGGELGAEDSRSAEQAVAVLRVTSAASAVMDRLVARSEYRAVQLQGRVLHSWDAGGADEVFCQTVAARGSTDLLLLLSGDAGELLRGLRVLEGAAPSLRGAPGPALDARPAAGSFFYAEATGAIPGLDDIRPASSIADKASGVLLDLSERDGLLGVSMAVETESPEDALAIHSLATGALALANVALENDERLFEMQEVLGNLRLSVAGDRVGADLHFESRLLVEVLHETAETLRAPG
ncbi:MAG: hypothetical protein QF903_03675 [Planctomycetota bacterium]|jgi:hypothetical protein|nr:hypothetical protein [Planctomycetota bacterium]MDP6988556.1 hypothetical protein [Planctomycetota bacterium]